MNEILDRLLISLSRLPVVPEDRAELTDCALCPRRSVNAYIVQSAVMLSPGPARWLQLCGPCNKQVRSLVRDEWPGDDAVLRRYYQLQAIEYIPPEPIPA